ncbi:MAG TPA: hypothetical protein VFV41_00180 [Streptosporangiaceae bacterium]|nr:hypothetical protein [Streptosporangiaceae bacterium]
MTNWPRIISGPSTYGVTTAPPPSSGAVALAAQAGRSAPISPPARISDWRSSYPRGLRPHLVLLRNPARGLPRHAGLPPCTGGASTRAGDRVTSRAGVPAGIEGDRRNDRVADIWGSQTRIRPGSAWPARVDQYLEPSVPEVGVSWHQSACVLCSNGCGMDIAVLDGRIVGVRSRAADRVNRGRLGPKGLFGWQANNAGDRLTEPLPGNFRQGFSHPALINAVMHLIREDERIGAVPAPASALPRTRPPSLPPVPNASAGRAHAAQHPRHGGLRGRKNEAPAAAADHPSDPLQDEGDPPVHR